MRMLLVILLAFFGWFAHGLEARQVESSRHEFGTDGYVRFLAVCLNSDFIDRLELSPDQQKVVDDSLARWRTTTNAMVEQMNRDDIPIDSEELLSLQKGAAEAIIDVLLPHQLVLLSQYSANHEQSLVDLIKEQRGDLTGDEGTSARVALQLAFDERVLGDLEPTAEQRASVKELSISRMRINSNPEFKSLSPSEQQRRRVDFDIELHQSLVEMLLPHQQVRLDQLLARRELNKCGGSLAVYLPMYMGRELSLTDHQKDSMASIREAARKLLEDEAKQFQSRVGELLPAEKDQVFAELDEDQRQAMETELGDVYSEDGFDAAALKAVSDYVAKRMER